MNMESKLNECLETFNTFQTDLSGVIGIGGSSSESGASSGNESKSEKSSGSEKKSDSGSGSDTIVGAIQEGGMLINEALNGEEDSWSASFSSARDSIHETAASIVECIESMAESITNACIAAIEAINMLEQAQGEPGSRPIPSQYGRSGHNHGENGNAYAYGSNGLPKAKKNALVSEYGQTEMTVLPNGNAIITDTPTLMDLPKDTVIYNEEETKKIMDNKVDAGGAANADRKTIVNSGSTITTPDGSVLTPTSQEDYIRKLQKKSQESIIPQAERPYCVLEQERLEKCAAALGKSIDEMMNPMNIIARNIKDMTGMGKYMENTNNVSSAVDSRNIQQPVTVQIGDIHLTGVQDVNGLSQAIKTRLPGQMMQEYFKN